MGCAFFRSGREAGVLILVAGVHEHHADDVLRKPAGVEANVGAAQRMADQDVRSADGGGANEQVEIVDRLPAGPKRALRPGIGVARPTPGAIVRADPGDLGDTGLDGLPDRGRVPQPGLQDHGRTSGARAGQMKAPPANVHQPAGGRELSVEAPTAPRLVPAAQNHDEDDQADQAADDASQPAAQWRTNRWGRHENEANLRRYREPPCARRPHRKYTGTPNAAIANPGQVVALR